MSAAVIGGRQLAAPEGCSASLTRLPDKLPPSLQHLELLAIIGENNTTNMYWLSRSYYLGSISV